MKKIKKTFLYIFGSFLAFAFSQKGAFVVHAQLYVPSGTVYGPAPMSTPMSIFKTTLSIILSPIVIVIVIVLAIFIGMVIFIRRKRKNVKKDSQARETKLMVKTSRISSRKT